MDSLETALLPLWPKVLCTILVIPAMVCCMALRAHWQRTKRAEGSDCVATHHSIEYLGPRVLVTMFVTLRPPKERQLEAKRQALWCAFLVVGFGYYITLVV